VAAYRRAGGGWVDRRVDRVAFDMQRAGNIVGSAADVLDTVRAYLMDVVIADRGSARVRPAAAAIHQDGNSVAIAVTTGAWMTDCVRVADRVAGDGAVQGSAAAQRAGREDNGRAIGRRPKCRAVD